MFSTILEIVFISLFTFGAFAALAGLAAMLITETRQNRARNKVTPE